MNDLQAQHAAIRGELDAAIAGVIEHGRFIGGPEINRFEQHFAAYCATEYCIGTASGTSALEIALRAAGIGPGDEVLAPTFSFFATVEAIVNVGATPVLVDVDPATALVRTDSIEREVTSRSAAMIVVHLYGQPVDLAAFRELADRRKLLLVEDAAQAHGASSGGLRAGSVGDVATFSFFPGKNLGALGDAGAITTNDAAIDERARLLRNHGRTKKYEHGVVGTNARIDTLQAALLDVKLGHLDAWTEARRLHAAAYDEAFAAIDGVDPIEIAAEATSVYHLYTLRAADRDALQARLAERDIANAVHYPMPLHRQPAISEIAAGAKFPNAERLSETVVSIPLYPELSEADRAVVISAIAGY